MNRFLIILSIALYFFTNANAQGIEEIDGIYYRNSEPYTGSWTTHYDSGATKMEGHLVKGKKQGKFRLYFVDGTLNEIRSYKKNRMDGTWIEYNEGNVKVGEANYKKGMKHGKWFIWDENGRLIYEMQYKKGEKTGIWKKYSPDGKVLGEREY